MAQTLWLIRHAQASFGAADYDNLSELGHEQSRELGKALHALGCAPQVVCLGAMKRHRQTWEGINAEMGLDIEPQILPGFNEFDFTGLLNARFSEGEQPKGLHDDRRTHFKLLRDTVLDWQAGKIANPPETYEAFSDRVRGALDAAMATGAEHILTVSSGGAIGFTAGDIMGAPADAMIRMQLQVKNCALSRIILSPRGRHLSTFNETPHINAANEERLLTYS